MNTAAHDLKLAMTWWDWLEAEISRQHPTATQEEIYALTSVAMTRVLTRQED